MLKFDFRNMLGENVESGNYADEIVSMEVDFIKAMEELKKDNPGFISLLDNFEFVEEIEKIAEEFKWCENFVVLGIGGSALGNTAIQQSLRPLNWNFLDEDKRKECPRIFIWDNVDPEYILSNLEILDLSKTVFNVISKSGSTAEAMSNYLIVRGILEFWNLDVRKHLVFTTDPEKGVLNKIAAKDGISKLVIPPSVGGRFSVLTPVGLLSAMMAGIDVKKILNGAKESRDKMLNSRLWENNAGLIAVHHRLQYRKGRTISVMFAYSNALYSWADWYRQLWAESLGKQKDKNGTDVFLGPTPIKAIGPTDQHSQVQLYSEGKNDKVITFLKVENFRNTVRIPQIHGDIEELSYLGNRTLNELINFEQEGTAYALKKHDKPNLTVIFPTIDENNIGEFIFTYELATALFGYMENIDPFDQPGVEDGKIATYALMGRKGYEDLSEEIKKG